MAKMPLHAHIVIPLVLIDNSHFSALILPMRRHKAVVVSRHDEAKDDQEHAEMRQDEPGYHHRVVTE